jgi:hypothetical protein
MPGAAAVEDRGRRRSLTSQAGRPQAPASHSGCPGPAAGQAQPAAWQPGPAAQVSGRDSVNLDSDVYSIVVSAAC